jgi:hypothetical protein
MVLFEKAPACWKSNFSEKLLKNSLWLCFVIKKQLLWTTVAYFCKEPV